MEFTFLPEVLSIVDMEYDPIWAKKMHFSQNIEMVHVVSGELDLIWDNGESYTARAGQSLFNPPEQMHLDKFDFNSGLKILLIHFKWKHFDSFFKTVNNNNINQICNATSAQLKRLFDDLKLDSGPGENDRLLESARLMHILTLLYREHATENYFENDLSNSEDCRHRIVSEAKKFIDKNYMLPLRLEDIASELQISSFYLSRIFSSESDFSLFQYITDVRINEAKKLIRQNRHIINDIAMMVGYESQSYFSRVFKKQVGCSPGKYGKIVK